MTASAYEVGTNFKVATKVAKAVRGPAASRTRGENGGLADLLADLLAYPLPNPQVLSGQRLAERFHHQVCQPRAGEIGVVKTRYRTLPQ